MQAQIDRRAPGESELSLEIAASFELRQAKMAITGKYSKGKHLIRLKHDNSLSQN